MQALETNIHSELSTHQTIRTR